LSQFGAEFNFPFSAVLSAIPRTITEYSEAIGRLVRRVFGSSDNGRVARLVRDNPASDRLLWSDCPLALLQGCQSELYAAAKEKRNSPLMARFVNTDRILTFLPDVCQLIANGVPGPVFGLAIAGSSARAGEAPNCLVKEIPAFLRAARLPGMLLLLSFCLDIAGGSADLLGFFLVSHPATLIRQWVGSLLKRGEGYNRGVSVARQTPQLAVSAEDIAGLTPKEYPEFDADQSRLCHIFGVVAHFNAEEISRSPDNLLPGVASLLSASGALRHIGTIDDPVQVGLVNAAPTQQSAIVRFLLKFPDLDAVTKVSLLEKLLQRMEAPKKDDLLLIMDFLIDEKWLRHSRSWSSQ
jgi:hypothetical protein